MGIRTTKEMIKECSSKYNLDEQLLKDIYTFTRRYVYDNFKNSAQPEISLQGFGTLYTPLREVIMTKVKLYKYLDKGYENGDYLHFLNVIEKRVDEIKKIIAEDKSKGIKKQKYFFKRLNKNPLNEIHRIGDENKN